MQFIQLFCNKIPTLPSLYSPNLTFPHFTSLFTHYLPFSPFLLSQPLPLPATLPSLRTFPPILSIPTNLSHPLLLPYLPASISNSLPNPPFPLNLVRNTMFKNYDVICLNSTEGEYIQGIYLRCACIYKYI